MPEYSTKGEAERLVRSINAYWLIRGVVAGARAKQIRMSDSVNTQDRYAYVIESDLKGHENPHGRKSNGGDLHAEQRQEKTDASG
ncbi:MAG: hypothetical protein ACR2RE_12965 [Geminicoccaceae bacterium]